jgi:hypothetical protein
LAVGYEKRFPSEILLQAGAPERLDRSLLEGVSGVVMAGGASLGGEGQMVPEMNLRDRMPMPLAVQALRWCRPRSAPLEFQE